MPYTVGYNSLGPLLKMHHAACQHALSFFIPQFYFITPFLFDLYCQINKLTTNIV